MKKYLSIRLVLLINVAFGIGCSSKTSGQPQLTFTPYINNISTAVDIKNAGDGSGRLFIVQQSGAIRVYKNGALLTKPFLNMKSLIKYNGGEEGLLSIAFPPNYERGEASGRNLCPSHVGRLVDRRDRLRGESP